MQSVCLDPAMLYAKQSHASKLSLKVMCLSVQSGHRQGRVMVVVDFHVVGLGQVCHPVVVCVHGSHMRVGRNE